MDQDEMSQASQQLVKQWLAYVTSQVILARFQLGQVYRWGTRSQAFMALSGSYWLYMNVMLEGDKGK
jgi:hypothetical protein